MRAAGGELDGALYVTAAFTGLRMGELLALRWRDIDFAGSTVRVRASFYNGHLSTPKSGKVRAVPLAPDVATALAQLGRRENWIGDDDLVFAGEGGDHLDASALRRRYKTALAAAGLRPGRGILTVCRLTGAPAVSALFAATSSISTRHRRPA